jgi:ABC-2 type transport system permease protein
MSITATATATRRDYRLTRRGVLAGEWTKFGSLRSTWITLGVSVLLLVAIGLIAAASFDPNGTRGPRAGQPEDAIGIALAGTTFAALAVGVLGVLLSAGEYTTGMIRSTLTAVPTRLPVLWAKSLIAGGVALVLMAAGGLVSFLLGSPLLHAGVTALGLGDDGVLRSLAGAGLYLGLVAVLGVGLGALVRSSAGSIAILVGTLLILPGLVSLLPDSWSANISPYLPSTAGEAVMTLHPGSGSLSPGAGIAVFAGYVVLVLIGAAYRLKTTDA